MIKIRIIFALGLATALMPFIGIPGVWQDRGYIVFGLVISILAFLLRQESKNMMRARNGDQSSGVFVENTSVENTENTDSKKLP